MIRGGGLDTRAVAIKDRLVVGSFGFNGPLRNKMSIPTFRKTIPEMQRFLFCAEHIYLLTL